MNLNLITRYLLIICAFGITLSLQALPTTANHRSTAAEWVEAQEERTYSPDEARRFLESDRKTVEAELGRKLTFKEKILFKVAKRQAKRAVKKNQDADFASSGDTGLLIGLLLGVLLGLIGVLIAYIIGNDSQPGIVKGSWYGFLILLGVILLSVLL